MLAPLPAYLERTLLIASSIQSVSSGVELIFGFAVRVDVMHAFAVGDVWGVGSATARKLADLGIHTAAALRDMPMKHARGMGTVVLERLVAELRGVPANAVEAVEPRRKGMAVTRSFGKSTGRISQICSKLRRRKLLEVSPSLALTSEGKEALIAVFPELEATMLKQGELAFRDVI